MGGRADAEANMRDDDDASSVVLSLENCGLLLVVLLPAKDCRNSSELSSCASSPSKRLGCAALQRLCVLRKVSGIRGAGSEALQ